MKRSSRMRRGWVNGALVALALCGLACGAEPPRRERVSLIDHDAWRELSAAEDPFEDRPAEVECDREGWLAEDAFSERSLQVTTRFCDYLTVQQPALVDVRAGEVVRVRVFHFALTASVAAQGHVAVRVGDLAWEGFVEIPSASGLVLGEIEVDEGQEVGVPVTFHLHNHGENSWNLIEVSTGL